MNSFKTYAGFGSQALGVMRFGFEHDALAKFHSKFRNMLRLNAAPKNKFLTVANHA